MLTFTNTVVNIKDKDGFFVPHERKTISYKTKNCTIINLTGRQILVTIKRIKTAEKNTIIKKQLYLNNLLLNYFKRGQIIYCRGFCAFLPMTSDDFGWQ